VYYKEVESQKALKSTKQEIVVMACLFFACRNCGTPRTFKELCSVTKLDLKAVKRTFTKLKTMRLIKAGIKGKLEAKRAIDMAHYCRLLHLPISVETEAMKVVESVWSEVQGMQPATIAAAALFFVTENTKDAVPLEELALKTQVAASTISEKRHRIAEELQKQIEQQPRALGSKFKPMV